MRHLARTFWLALVMAGSAGAFAAPHVPASDAVVLARVPAAVEARRLEPLRAKLKADPADEESAMRLAQGYLLIARETSDPRFLSYASAALSPWLTKPNPPAPMLVLSATALQSAHRFDEALVLLERALQIDPRNGQAWLTKATLLQVKGDFPAARAACRPLLSVDQLVAITCLASVDSFNGKLDTSYRSLTRAAGAAARMSAEERGWMFGQLAEMAVRLGDLDSAGRHYRFALSATPNDAYLKAAYADLLLLTGRERDVLPLLRDSESNDVLLLRLAIAGKRVNDSRADEWARMFDARRRAARPGDKSHLREHARFLLDVRDQPIQALEMAEANWRVQRESADVRLYVQSAAQAQHPEAENVIREWIRVTGYEDRTLR